MPFFISKARAKKKLKSTTSISGLKVGIQFLLRPSSLVEACKLLSWWRQKIRKKEAEEALKNRRKNGFFLYRNKHGQLVQSIYKNPSKQFLIAAERFCSKCNQKQRVPISESQIRIAFSLQKCLFSRKGLFDLYWIRSKRKSVTNNVMFSF